MSSWKDVPFSLGVTLDKRVLLTELPAHLGESSSLDKQIAAALQTGGANLVYFLEEGLLIRIAPDSSLGFDEKEICWIELEIEGTSSGYYDPGCISGPPENWYPEESDDERLITSVNAVFHDESHQVLGHMELTDEGLLNSIQQAFNGQLYEVALHYPNEY